MQYTRMSHHITCTCGHQLAALSLCQNSAQACLPGGKKVESGGTCCDGDVAQLAAGRDAGLAIPVHRRARRLHM